MTNKSKSVFGGRPSTSTFNMSTGPPAWMLALPFAFATQSAEVLSAGDRTRPNGKNLPFPAGHAGALVSRVRANVIAAADRIAFLFTLLLRLGAWEALLDWAVYG